MGALLWYPNVNKNDELFQYFDCPMKVIFKCEHAINSISYLDIPVKFLTVSDSVLCCVYTNTADEN